VFIENQPTDALTHETAIRIARRCRHIIQAVLREEEWADADREFYRVAREELEAMAKERRPTLNKGG
jgi:hypothetical protein